MEKTVSTRHKQPVPKMFRRDIRLRKAHRRGYPLTPTHRKVGDARFNIIGVATWNDQAIYIPKRKKLKGWQKNRA